MTIDLAARRTDTADGPGDDRFRLHRAGILNIWQYDAQEFSFADGRLLLRGTNGAGKSKTLEILLPFALDGDKAKITASAKHHTSLLWLMTDGYEGQARVGYVWLEFLRQRADGSQEAFTCGVGLRASASARTATAWHFATDLRIGQRLMLEDDAGPLSRPRLEAALGADGHVFEKASAYKEHVGRVLFGLDVAQYDQVLRLLYWLRQPQVGEDIEPAKLAAQLSQALPPVEEHALRSAGDTFDELTAFGEQIERRAAAADALGALAAAFTTYARAVAAERGRALAVAVRTERSLHTAVRRQEAQVDEAERDLADAEESRREATAGLETDEARLRALDADPAARDQRRLTELTELLERSRGEASRARERVAQQSTRRDDKRSRVDIRAQEVARGAADLAEDLRVLSRREREVVAAPQLVPPVGDEVVLTGADDASRLAESLHGALDGLSAAESAVRGRVAAVAAVREAVREVEGARARQVDAEGRADEAERRWEQSRAVRLEAQRVCDDEEAILTSSLAEWARAPEAPLVDVPVELIADALDALPGLARAAARPGLDRLRADEQRAATRRDNADAEVNSLSGERSRVEAEPEPSPPPPAVGRTDRPDGRALWRLVDFADHLPEGDRAGLEAALQGAGLLDAWVRPGGRLLDAEHRDVVLSAPSVPDGHAVTGTLADVVRPDLPADSGVAADDVRRILTAIRLTRTTGPPVTSDLPGEPVRVGLDGTWRLGPAYGRATKEQAQYVGATARAAERARRLEALDRAIEEQRRRRGDADADLVVARDAIAALERWERRLPSTLALRQARTQLEAVREVERRDDTANREARRRAEQARAVTAAALTALDRVATGQGLPTDADALDAVDQRLRGLLADLERAARAVPALAGDLRRWAADSEDLRADEQTLALEEQEARAAVRRAEATDAELGALRESAGDSVHALGEKVAAARASKQRNRDRLASADDERLAATAALATARTGLGAARDQVAEQVGRRGDVVASVAALAAPPGLLTAATGEPHVHDAVLALSTLDSSDPVPAALARAAETLAGLGDVDPVAARNAVYTVHREASTGPAADHQPAVAPYETSDLLAVIGQDDGGEAPVVELARRVRTAVDRDRGLLTEREKKQFEQHVLGELGDAIRRCRRDAEELVAAMNSLLGDVSTSQGIRVRLDWKLRDDVPAEAREAVGLLAQPVGALIPEERATLRDVLHRLIDASRAQSPELSYGEHLAVALDYRTWSGFTIRYTRPEKPGHWDRLHRRSPLSQGEQKVLCYLPLFAAAAAHFTSLAGAAPHAPRLVLLDDAFPKIDVRTHPLLFGLLVQLDLDFVMTSERLWGDHATVPSLAIYEALRDPGSRGIAQYEYRWDGRQLQSLG